MATLPSSLALTTISDGALATAADLRNNFTAIQTENNSLLTILGAGTAGDVFAGVGTTVQFAKPPGYEYTHNEITAPVSITATSAATAQTVATASAVTFDGTTTVMVEFFAPSVQPQPTAAAAIVVSLWDSTDIGQIGQIFTPAASTMTAPMLLRRRLTPSAGSHTYVVKSWVTSGTGTIQAGAAGVATTVPAYIRITKA